MAALAGGPAVAHADYPGQSNESWATAFGPLSLNTPYAASLQTTNDTDYYYFYASAAQQQIHVSYTNTSSGEGGCELLDLYNSKGEDLGEEFGRYGVCPGEVGGTLSYSVPSSGKYYLTVVAVSDAPADQSIEPPEGYSFTITSPQPLLSTLTTSKPSTPPPTSQKTTKHKAKSHKKKHKAKKHTKGKAKGKKARP